MFEDDFVDAAYEARTEIHDMPVECGVYFDEPEFIDENDEEFIDSLEAANDNFERMMEARFDSMHEGD
jgi:hypothetical protein